MLVLLVASNLVAQGASLSPADAFLIVLWLIVYVFLAVIKLSKGVFKKTKATNLKRILNMVQSSPLRWGSCF